MKLEFKDLIKIDDSFDVFDINNYDGEGSYLLENEKLCQYSISNICQGMVYSTYFSTSEYLLFKNKINIDKDDKTEDQTMLDKEFILEFARILKG